MSASTPRAPGVQFRPFFHGRDPSVASGALTVGGDGAEDLVPAQSLYEPVSAGRPPVPPRLPASIELVPLVRSVGAASGWRVTSSPVVGGGEDGSGPPALWRVVVELEWGPMTSEQWLSLRAFLVDQVGVGGEGGSLRAVTIDVDGDGLTDSAVDVRLLAVGDLDTLVHVAGGTAAGLASAVYTFGPVKAEECW